MRRFKVRVSTERGIAICLALIVLLILLFVRVEQRPKFILESEVWRVVQREAGKNDLDPAFVFAIAMAESSLNARADSGVGRGIMQLSEAAWSDSTDAAYGRAWNWEDNIAVGILYLSHLSERLEGKGRYTYPLLAASYRYGFTYVESVSFDINRIRPPRNQIYRQLFRGLRAPVLLPHAE